MHNCYMEKIIKDGNTENMRTLSKAFDKAMHHLKECDKECYEDIEMCLYEAAFGKVLNEEMAQKIILNMKPYGMHWTLEETKNVQLSNNLSGIRAIDFWIVMNAAYNDYYNLFTEDISAYVSFAKAFINDEDAKEGKVFTYFTKIPK